MKLIIITKSMQLNCSRFDYIHTALGLYCLLLSQHQNKGISEILDVHIRKGTERRRSALNSSPLRKKTPQHFCCKFIKYTRFDFSAMSFVCRTTGAHPKLTCLYMYYSITLCAEVKLQFLFESYHSYYDSFVTVTVQFLDSPTIKLFSDLHFPWPVCSHKNIFFSLWFNKMHAQITELYHFEKVTVRMANGVFVFHFELSYCPLIQTHSPFFQNKTIQIRID